MATLYNYTIPANIRWNKSGTDLLTIKPGGEAGTLVAWTSQYYTFQVQYRTRERYSLAALAGMGSNEREVWTTWSAWTDPENAVPTDTKSTTAKSGQVITYTGHPFAFTYDWTTYDARQVDMRVRVIDELSLTVSEWAYWTLHVAYAPTVTATAAHEADGTISVAVTSDWVRSGSTLSVSDPRRCEVNVSNQSLGPYWGWLPWQRWGGITQRLTDDTGDTEFIVPGANEQDGHIYFGQFSFITGDGAKGLTSALVYAGTCTADQYASYGLAIPLVYDIAVTAHTDDPGITEPTVTTSVDDAGNLIITSTDASYDGVNAWVSWTDGRGTFQQLQVEMTKDGGSWHGIVTAPPYDVEIDVAVTAVDNGDWRMVTTTATVPSNGILTLHHIVTAESVSVLYNARETVQRRFDNEVATFKPAGSSRPKSRYGEGGSMGISVSGISPDVSIAYDQLYRAGVAAFAQLETWGDWILRIPGGERYSVVLKSYALNNSPANGFYDIALDMEVVG